MNQDEVLQQLNQVSSSGDFLKGATDLTEQWSRAADSFDVVEPVLRFMESNPSLDLGTPGPLVHFVEKFYRKGYEQKLAASISRQPTKHTVWMLNRVINGAKSPAERERLIAIMRSAKENPNADRSTRELIDEMLENSAE